MYLRLKLPQLMPRHLLSLLLPEPAPVADQASAVEQKAGK